ncbi:hypothetical protein [Caldiplasma sukawensis]
MKNIRVGLKGFIFPIIVNFLLILFMIVPIVLYYGVFLSNFLYFVPYPIIVIFMFIFTRNYIKNQAYIEFSSDYFYILTNERKKKILYSQIDKIENNTNINRKFYEITLYDGTKIGIFDRKIIGQKNTIIGLIKNNKKQKGS